MSDKPSAMVLAAGSLGDSLLTLPALHALQSRFDVTLAGTPSYLALGSELLGIHKVLPLDPLLQILLSRGISDPVGPAFWKEFEEVYLFFKDKDEKLLKILNAGAEPISQIPPDPATTNPPFPPLTKGGQGGFKVIIPSKPFSEFLKEGRWAAEYWLETAVGKPVPYDSPLRHAKLEIGSTLKEKGSGILQSLGLDRPLVIHPGSGSPDKNAPLSFFRNAAEKSMAESQKQVLVIWGEAEQATLGNIQEAFKGLPGVVVLPEILGLRELVGVFSQSAAYLGNDSGITQLASACSLRTFAVFNSTDSRIWGPQEAVILAAMKNLYS